MHSALYNNVFHQVIVYTLNTVLSLQQLLTCLTGISATYLLSYFFTKSLIAFGAIIILHFFLSALASSTCTMYYRRYSVHM